MLKMARLFTTALFHRQQDIKNRVPSALVWEGMKTAKSLGCTIFDFGGIADPRYPGDYKKWVGFTKFKEGFSPTPLLYPPSFRTPIGWWSLR
jgi:lipid II:glycine glycyltransferase (peptidoglycan interpeptide bridge formation enzyme)